MSRKRNKPHFSRYTQNQNNKRPRRTQAPFPSSSTTNTDTSFDDNTTRENSSATVVVTGLSSSYSVLNLKSRFEMYGSISQLWIDRDIGYLTFRSKDSAEAAIAVAADPFTGIDVDSKKVQVSWAEDPLPQWREKDAFSSKERPSSKLLLPEVPFSRRRRGNKLRSPSVSPKNNRSNLSFKGRDIIAYDDLFLLQPTGNPSPFIHLWPYAV